MSYTMKVIFWTYNFVNQIANYMVGSVTPCTLLAGNVRLMTAFSIAPNQNSVPGDFTEATFAGYAAAPIGAAMAGPGNLPNEAGVQLYGQVVFAASSLLAPGGQTIIGYWIDDGATPPHVLGSEIFPTAIPIGHPGDLLLIDVALPVLFQVPTGF